MKVQTGKQEGETKDIQLEAVRAGAYGVRLRGGGENK